MYNNASERRIRNNRLRRKRQIRRNLYMMIMAVILTAGFSVMFFSFKARAQEESETPSAYKYYKSVTVGGGDTIWDFACLYADTDFYESYEGYIKEVMDINHLKDEQIVYGQHIIVPYYSSEFKG